MSDSAKGDRPPDAANVYAEQLRIHAITLIWRGFRRLNAASLVDSEEDDITGELAREIDRVTIESNEEWIDWYEIHEQRRKHRTGVFGKRRPIMDIEFVRRVRPRPKLGFEAKRLGRSGSIASYLGEGGLAAFLVGHYPTTNQEAGMLGYVQKGTAALWAKQLSQELAINSTKHCIHEGGEFRECDVAPDMPAFLSGHSSTTGSSMSIIHVLLPFSK